MFNLFKKSIFGLNISDYSIEAVSLEGSTKNPKLTSMSRVILDPGIVEDGQIIQKEKLKNILVELVRKPKFGKFKTNKLIFALPESRAFIQIFKVPHNFKKGEIKKEVEFQAVQNFPFSPKDLCLDFKTRNNEILLVGISKDIVQDYLELFKNLKLQPVALEIESLSLARALIGNKKETFLILDIGARTTNFSIFDKEGLRLSITIEIAGNKLTKALAEKLNISFSDAENLKKKIGLNPEVKEGKVFLVLQKEILEIISEINKIEEYFKEKEQKSFEKIILAGGSAALPHLSDYLAENLERSVLIGDPWEKINIDLLRKQEYSKEAFKVNPVLYSPAIGSALRGLIKNPATVEINLLPKK